MSSPSTWRTARLKKARGFGADVFVNDAYDLFGDVASGSLKVTLTRA